MGFTARSVGSPRFNGNNSQIVGPGHGRVRTNVALARQAIEGVDQNVRAECTELGRHAEIPLGGFLQGWPDCSHGVRAASHAFVVLVGIEDEERVVVPTEALTNANVKRSVAIAAAPVERGDVAIGLQPMRVQLQHRPV